MKHDTLLGPAFPDLGWVPAPRYLMRRARVLALSKHLRPGTVLEVGPGAGTLLMEFTERGFDCQALEPSGEAREMAARLLAADGKSIPVHAAPAPDWKGKFDVLFAFDVLEHIEDDSAALAQWRDWLRPDGCLLLSVPARMRLWTAGDVWAGHFRRYEWEQLEALLQRQGFTIDRFECYGFPLTNMTERVSAPAYRKLMRQAGNADDNRQSNNDRSGVDRRPHLRAYPLLASMPGKLALRACFALQRLFLRRDWGSGYILRAVPMSGRPTTK